MDERSDGRLAMTPAQDSACLVAHTAWGVVVQLDHHDLLLTDSCNPGPSFGMEVQVAINLALSWRRDIRAE